MSHQSAVDVNPNTRGESNRMKKTYSNIAPSVSVWQTKSEKLFPLNGRWGFAAHVVGHAIDTAYFIDDAA